MINSFLDIQNIPFVQYRLARLGSHSELLLGIRRGSIVLTTDSAFRNYKESSEFKEHLKGLDDQAKQKATPEVLDIGNSISGISHFLRENGFNPLNASIDFSNLLPHVQNSAHLGKFRGEGAHVPGCYVLFGGSGSGKSTIMKHLALDGVQLVSVGEPDGFSLDIHVSMLNYTAVALARLSYLFPNVTVSGSDAFSEMNKLPKYFLFDSFRELVYSAGGNALSGGISSGLLNALTNLSKLSASSGLFILGAINPMDISGNSDKQEALLDAINGACSGIVFDVNLVNYDTGDFKGYVNSRHLKRVKTKINSSVEFIKMFGLNPFEEFNRTVNGEGDVNLNRNQPRSSVDENEIVESNFVLNTTSGEIDPQIKAKVAGIMNGTSDNKEGEK